MRKAETLRQVLDINGNLLQEKNQIKERQSEYFADKTYRLKNGKWQKQE